MPTIQNVTARPINTSNVSGGAPASQGGADNRPVGASDDSAYVGRSAPVIATQSGRTQTLAQKLYDLAATVKVAKTEGRGVPMSGKSLPELEAKGEVLSLDRAFALWGASRRPDLWNSAQGMGIAHYALGRLGLAAIQGDKRRDKIVHSATILWHANQIADEQAKKGSTLTPRWREYLEYATLLHDVGYANGGRFHPRTGALDVLAMLQKHLSDRGAPTLSKSDLEKISVLIEMHGTSFPWDKCEPLLVGEFYADVALAKNMMAPQKDRLKQVLRDENKDYEPKLASADKFPWLDDPAELDGLMTAGWILHSADNENSYGPSRDLEKISSQPARTTGGRLGKEIPASTLAELMEVRRSEEVEAAVRYIMRDGMRPLYAVLKLSADAVSRRGSNGSAAKALGDLQDTLRTNLDAAHGMFAEVVDGVSTHSSKEVANAVRNVLTNGWIQSVVQAFEDAPAEVQRALPSKQQLLGHLGTAVNQAAGAIEEMRDR